MSTWCKLHLHEWGWERRPLENRKTWNGSGSLLALTLLSAVTPGAMAQSSAPGNERAQSHIGAAANGSEQRDGSLVVHVFKVESSVAPLHRETGQYQLTTNGPIAQGETVTPKPGFSFLTIVFETRSKSDEFKLSTQEVVLAQLGGKTYQPIKFFPAQSEFVSLLGATVGRKGDPANGQFAAVFGIPKTGMNDLIFRVSGTDVGSIQELKKVLSAGGSSNLPVNCSAPGTYSAVYVDYSGMGTGHVRLCKSGSQP